MLKCLIFKRLQVQKLSVSFFLFLSVRYIYSSFNFFSRQTTDELTNMNWLIFFLILARDVDKNMMNNLHVEVSSVQII